MSDLRRRVAQQADRRAGLDTARAVDAAALGYDREELRGYQPSYWLGLYAVLPRRSVGDGDVLLDIGSGKGRVIVQAAQRYRFRRVVGLELSPALTAVAADNVRRARPRLGHTEVQLITGDAATVTVPSDVTIAYLYNPFHGVVFDCAIDRLVEHADRSHRPLRLIYVNAVEHERLATRPSVVEVPAPPWWRLLLGGLPAGGVRTYELRPTP